MMTHLLEGRKRNKLVGDLRNQARCKRSLTGGEEEGGVGWRAQKHGTLQTRTHRQEGRIREESIRELGNMAHQRAHLLEGRKGRSALVSSETWHIANKDSLARGEEEGGGRSRLVSSEMWHVANEDSLARGEEEGGGRSGVLSLEMWHVTNDDSLPGRREEEGIV